MRRAVLAAGPAHIVSRNLENGHRVVFDDYSTATGGTQTITIDAIRADVRVVGQLTYAKGNPTALTKFFKLSKTVAGRIGQRWFALAPGDPHYDTITAGVTLSSTLDEYAFPPPYKIVHRRMNGRPVVQLQSAAAGAPKGSRVILSIAAVGKPLPISFEVVSPGSGRTNVTFSAWGKSRPLTVPQGAIRLTSVLGPSTAV